MPSNSLKRWQRRMHHDQGHDFDPSVPELQEQPALCEDRSASRSESRDKATIRALDEIDPGLAGLFRLGRELCGRPDEPGLAYLIAHAGRELVFGVVSELEDTSEPPGTEPLEASTTLSAELEERVAQLLGEGDEVRTKAVVAAVMEVLRGRTSAADESQEARNEDFRRRIATALQLSPNHPLVKQWFRVHRAMQRGAHARIPAPQAAPLRVAFAELAELLFGRVGPIFETQAELDRLAAVAVPDERDLARVRQLVPRAVQRRYFFRQLQAPAWVAPLRSDGFFAHPPEREVYPDGSWRMRPWPEGEYLLRMASSEPEDTLEALRAIPDTVQNPVVWGIVADAVSVLPIEKAVRLVPKIRAALQRQLAVHFSRRALKATVRLARDRSREAFDVALALVRLRSAPTIPLRETGETSDAYVTRLKEMRGPFVRGDAWAFNRIDHHEIESLVAELIPALERLDPRGTLELVAERLLHTVRCVRRVRRLLSDRIREATDTTTGVDEGRSAETVGDVDDDRSQLSFDDLLASGEDEPGDSHRWCDVLDVGNHDADVRAMLARCVLSLGRRLIAEGAPAEDIIASLDRDAEEIFRRIQWRLMADLPNLTLTLRARLDTFLGSADALWPPYRARETAALLRAHFGEASASAQHEFVDALERGPGDEYVNSIIEFRRESNTSEARAEAIADWQRVRIRWFQERIPAALASLAERLGVQATVPDRMQQSLDEVGSWSTGVFSASYKSPLTADRLGELSPGDLAHYLATWQPGDANGHPFDRPSKEGLRAALTSLVADSPERVPSLLSALKSKPISLGYVAAIVDGLRPAVDQKKSISFDAVLSAADHAWRASELAPRVSDEDPRQAIWTAVSACEVIEAALNAEIVSQADFEALWRFARDVVASELTWRDTSERNPPTTFDEVWQLSRSHLASRVIRMLVAIAWRDFLLANPGIVWPPPGRSDAATRLIPLLEDALSRSGTAAIAVQAAIGEGVPRLFCLAQQWTSANLARLFEGGAKSPSTRPAWSMFLRHAPMMVPTFKVLRPWYASAAGALRQDGDASAYDRDWTLGNALANHVIEAVIHGLCRAGDEDRIVETTFGRVPVKTRTQAYWTIFRGWSDREPEAASALSPNVVAFWEWRLGELERLPANASRSEEADGLCWFLATPHLSPNDTIRLGRRTVALLGAEHHTTGLAWGRLSALAAVDPVGTFDIVSRLIELSLESDLPYLAFDDVAPSLRAAIQAGEPVRSRALSLVNRLGEVGLDEYRTLWIEAQE